MISKWILIGIVMGVFFVGIGVGYALLPSTQTVPMMMASQHMMNDPNQMIQWHQTMMNNPQLMDSWMDGVFNEPKLRQQMINRINQEEMEESPKLDELALLEKQDLRVALLKQMEVHNQKMASIVPYYSDDPNLDDMMTEKMVEHNYLMNELLDQKTTVSELEESIEIHAEEHRQLAELIASQNQEG